jgi:hypothetical protein
LGEQRLKNIARPIRIFNILDRVAAAEPRQTLALSDKPSIAVLTFQNRKRDSTIVISSTWASTKGHRTCTRIESRLAHLRPRRSGTISSSGGSSPLCEGPSRSRASGVSMRCLRVRKGSLRPRSMSEMGQRLLLGLWAPAPP